MNQTILFIVVFILVSISTISLQITFQKSKQKKIFELLKSGDIQAVEHELNSASCRMLIPAFNREFIKLNAYLLNQKTDKIDEQFDILFKTKMNDQQRKEALLKAFEYYVQLKDKEKSSALLQEIKNLDDYGLAAHSQMLYDILIDKSTNYIDVLTAKQNEGNNMNRGMNAYLISLQYGYLNKKDKEKEYLEKSKKYFTTK